MRIVWVRFNRKEKFVVLVIAVLLVAGGAARAIFLGGTSPASTCTEVPLSNGLVSWWKMDGNANDSSGNGNNGTVNGATLTNDNRGHSNCAYSFDGSTNSITAGNLTYTKNMPFSVSAWFNQNSGTNAAIFNKYASGSWNGFNLFVPASGKLCAWYLTNGTINNNYTAIAQDGGVGSVACPSFTNNAWHHVVVTVSSSGMVMYLDGAQAATSSWTGSTGNSTESTGITIGYYNGAPGSAHFGGSIDDIRLYNRLLSASEDSYLYAQHNISTLNVDSGEKGLLGWWKMDGNAKDSTPYGDNGTVTSATLTTDREGAANSAYSFNGSSSRINVPITSFPASMTATTASFWAKPTTAVTSSVLSSDVDSGSNRYNVHLPWSDNTIYWDFGNIGSNGRLTAAFNGAWFNVWSMWTFTADATGMKIYRNGVQIATTTGHSTFTTTGKTMDFGYFSGGPSYWPGSIDDMRIYNRALSATEIATLFKEYNSQVSVSSLQSGEVGDWPLNINAKDNTPYAGNGTVTGATLTADREGRANSAYSFSGSSQYISIPNAVIQPYVVLSVSAWFKTSSTSGAIFGYQNAAVGGSPTNYVPLLYVGSDGKLRGEFYQGAIAPVTTAGTVNNGVWHHVVIVGSNNTQSMYLDGGLVGTLSGTITQLSMTTNQIGAAYSNTWPAASGWMYFNGSLDDVRVWNRALSAAEITALYKEYR